MDLKQLEDQDLCLPEGLRQPWRAAKAQKHSTSFPPFTFAEAKVQTREGRRPKSLRKCPLQRPTEVPKESFATSRVEKAEPSRHRCSRPHHATRQPLFQGISQLSWVSTGIQLPCTFSGPRKPPPTLNTTLSATDRDHTSTERAATSPRANSGLKMQLTTHWSLCLSCYKRPDRWAVSAISERDRAKGGAHR